MDRIRNAGLLCLAAFTTCEILAATPPEQLAALPAEADFFTELPIVLSVSRLAQPVREAPAAVTVIDAEMIRQSGARTISELLRLVPGFQVAEYIHGAPTAVYHGLTTDSAGWMQVLIDGRTQYSPLWFGGVNWNVLQVSLADIERIEVVRGSNSAAYGANAVRGVVNIITYTPAQTLGTQVAVAAGNRGARDVFVRHGWQTEGAAFRLSAEESRTDGLEHFHDSRVFHRAHGRSDVQLDANSRLELTLGAATVKQGDGYFPESGFHPTDPTWLHDDPARQRYVQSYYGQLNWINHLAGGDEFRVRYFRVHETGSMKYHALFDAIPPTFGTGPGESLDPAVAGDFEGDFNYRPSITRDDVEVQHTIIAGDSRFIWGLGGRNDRVLFPQIYGRYDPLSVQLLRAFGTWEWRLRPNVLMNLAGTYEHESIAGGGFAPRLMFNWLATPEQTLRAGVSRAYRTPSLSEQRSNSTITASIPSVPGSTVTVPDSLSVRKLDNEEMTSFEIGYLGEWKSRGLMLDLRAFREELRDRVIQYPTADTSLCLFGICPNVWANAQDVNTQGIEGQLRWAPTPKTRFMLNHSVLQITARTHPTANNDLSMDPNGLDKAGDANRHAIRSAPSNQTSLHWVQILPYGLESSLAYYRVPAHKWTTQTDLPAYERIDWRLGYPFRLEGVKGELALTLRAIGGGHAEYRRNTVPLPVYKNQIVGPSGFLSMRLDF